MAISDKLETLNGIKSDIKAAIIAKGGTVENDFTTYATAISNLPSGGGGDDEVLRDLIEKDITSINIPSGTTKIGDYTFHNCTSLTSVSIPNSVTSIGSNAFYNCNRLTSVSIPDTVTMIGGSAFYNCTGLTSVNIPNSMTAINSSTFYNCTGLRSVSIPDTVTMIGGSAFYCCGLTSVTIPNSVTQISASTFQSCNNLTSVTIPDTVTLIGKSVFQSCISLTSVTIPDSVTSIGAAAFKSCTSLTSITSLNTTPPTIRSDTFQNVPVDCPIYVPAESVADYQAAEYWSSRADYIQAIQEDTGILFGEYQGFTNNTDFGDFDGYDTSETIILPFNDPSGTGTSSVGEMIQADSIVTDNLGNDITADCTFTYSGDWHYSEQMCDDGEGNETPCSQGLYNSIGVDDDHTPYTGELIASYTTSDNQTLTSSLNFSWTQTSNGQDPGE